LPVTYWFYLDIHISLVADLTRIQAENRQMLLFARNHRQMHEVIKGHIKSFAYFIALDIDDNVRRFEFGTRRRCV
jgi:hypothetical protein